jgi:hypothetical protein
MAASNHSSQLSIFLGVSLTGRAIRFKSSPSVPLPVQLSLQGCGLSATIPHAVQCTMITANSCFFSKKHLKPNSLI